MAEPRVLLSAEHLLHNLELLHETYGGRAVCPVIKAQAYGHGLVEIAKVLESKTHLSKVPFFCVARLREAQLLRNAGVSRKLLVLSAFDPSRLMADLPSDVDIALGSMPDLKSILGSLPKTQNKKFGVHLNFDTGMHRLGFQTEDVLKHSKEFFQDLGELAQRGVFVEGLMTHLACSEEPAEKFSSGQVKKFEELLKAFKKHWDESQLGPFPLWIHVSNSEGVTKKLALPEGATACRVGLHLWGAFSGHAEQKASPLGKKLKPVMRVVAPLKRLCVLKAGEGVGYGQKFQATKKRLIGTFALGYADGLPRSLSRSEDAKWTLGMVVDGKRLPFAGVISMDLCAVDLTEHPHAKQWEKEFVGGTLPKVWAEWIGAEQRAEEIADHLGTISYEIFCRLGSRLARQVGGDLDAT